jgi:hypothetical protein
MGLLAGAVAFGAEGGLVMASGMGKESGKHHPHLSYPPLRPTQEGFTSDLRHGFSHFFGPDVGYGLAVIPAKIEHIPGYIFVGINDEHEGVPFSKKLSKNNFAVSFGDWEIRDWRLGVLISNLQSLK